jgi:hypothetical protein
MRKLSIVLIAALLLLSLATGAMAELIPDNVPHQVLPGEAGFTAAFGAGTFDSLWMDMSGAAELPSGAWNDDGNDIIRGPVDIGFTFHFMNGPIEPMDGWNASGGAPVPAGWPSELTDEGYDLIYVSPNGYLVPADPNFMEWTQDPNRGSMNKWAEIWLGPARPNNIIAPFWSDWIIGDNTRRVVEDVCYSGGEWVVCDWSMEERPRGRLLFHTFGSAPNRVFVVEWQNARNNHSGDLASFQVQLFEGSNAILFLYGDADPTVDGRPFVQPAAVIGVEDLSGKHFVGEAFSAGMWDWNKWVNGPAPVADGDMWGFVVD